MKKGIKKAGRGSVLLRKAGAGKAVLKKAGTKGKTLSLKGLKKKAGKKVWKYMVNRSGVKG